MALGAGFDASLEAVAARPVDGRERLAEKRPRAAWQSSGTCSVDGLLRRASGDVPG